MKQWIFYLGLCACIFLASANPWDPIQVQILQMPPRGEEGTFTGVVTGVSDFSRYKVACYFYYGLWVSKPTYANPSLSLDENGHFSYYVTTTPYKVGLFLVYDWVTVPVAYETDSLPQQVIDLSLASVVKGRGLEFGGFDTWFPYDTTGSLHGPGPNIFSGQSNSVFVDSQNRMHLSILPAPSSYSKDYTCSSVYLKEYLGYGQYCFTTQTPVDLFDKHTVLGLFVWDDSPASASLPNPNREIDIEFSQWGDPSNNNTQFVVQPYYYDDNMRRFNTTFSSSSNLEFTTCFDWTPEHIWFRAYEGHVPQPKIFMGLAPEPVQSFLFTDQTYIPTPGTAYVIMNLWLFQGNDLSSKTSEEAIISDFSFVGIGKPHEHLDILPDP
eukprot:GCRY01000617.1.p1 GENE.GCRY01000617.1~~GCRY01000617.1.p1  ORF type:complete len:382 (+),score=42.67 GCRY01000617.1:73-1218(+)